MLKFRLITPDKIAFEADASRVTVPTATGEITILPGHIPLVSQLVHGELTVADANSKEYHFAVTSGFLSVSGNELKAIVESADNENEIDIQRAEEGRIRAEQLKEKAQSEEEIAIAGASLERALAQIKVAGRKHRHHS